jgi:hypothetical protein
MGRDHKIATNEGLFREVNDRVEEVAQEIGKREPDRETGEADFLCECGHEACTETVRMTVAEYENVRSDETLFVVFPGHEDASVEDVGERHERYVVVRKHPEEAAIAEATDPRRH